MSRTMFGRAVMAASVAVLVPACTTSGGNTPAAMTATTARAATTATTATAATSPAVEPSSTDSGPLLTSFPAPRAFGGAAVPVSLHALVANMAGDFTSRFILVGTRAYGVTGTSVAEVDLSTGTTVWESRFPNAAAQEKDSSMYDPTGPGAPMLSADGSTVYAALVVDVRGTGTTADSIALELVAVDAASGHLSWSVDVPAGSEVFSAASESIRIAGIEDGRVVLTRPGDGVATVGQVAVVDTSTQQLLWSHPGTVKAVSPEAVIVVAKTDTAGVANYPQLMGLDPGTGHLLWTGGTDEESAVVSVSAVQTNAGMVLTIKPYSGAHPYTVVVDPRTGRRKKVDGNVLLFQPVKDGDALYDTGSGVRALDPATLAVIWELPKGNRIAPRSPVFFGGRVYGQVNNGMSVVVDGKTGQDVAAQIPGSFVAVDNYGALMLRDGDVVFVPATA